MPCLTRKAAGCRRRRYLATAAAARSVPSTATGTACRSSRSSCGATSASSSNIAKNDANMSMSTGSVLTHKRETKTADGRLYWFNSVTKATSWTKPDDA